MSDFRRADADAASAAADVAAAEVSDAGRELCAQIGTCEARVRELSVQLSDRPSVEEVTRRSLRLWVKKGSGIRSSGACPFFFLFCSVQGVCIGESDVREVEGVCMGKNEN